MNISKMTLRFSLMLLLTATLVTVSNPALSNPPDCKEDCNNQGNACNTGVQNDYDYNTMNAADVWQACYFGVDEWFQECTQAADAAYDYCYNVTCGGAQTACLQMCYGNWVAATEQCYTFAGDYKAFCDENYYATLAYFGQIRDSGLVACDNQRSICLAGCPPE